jgi:hypothetical protein
MSAGLALKEARAAGVTFLIEGEHLLLEAPSAPPPDVLEALARHKAEILKLLRYGAASRSFDDWQALFDERAGIAEYDGGFGRLDAELCAFEDCVDHWLALHPPIANQHGFCLRCGAPVSPDEQASVVVTCSTGTTGRLHAGCAPTWKNLRRWDARTALIWLLDSTKRVAR